MTESSFGRYRLLELIGQGGMGQVYRAFDTATDRIVALKVLPPHATEDATFQQRFRREAHTAAGLNDPHVVPIHNYGEIDGRLYVDMRLIEGRDLGVVIKDDHRPLAPARAVRYIEQVAEALNAAHTAGLVHRDVKPSNILITPRDFVYLIDFGIARGANETRLTSTGLAIGTFAYMAPERFTAGESDPRTDIYALACVLHECLTGQTPFAGDSVEQQIAAHLMQPPPRPSAIGEAVPTSFDAVVATGLAKDPVVRYQTALKLANAARAALGTNAKAPAQHGVGQTVQPPKPCARRQVSASAATRAAPAQPARSSRPVKPAAGNVANSQEEALGAFFWITVFVVAAAFGVILTLVILKTVA